MPLLAHAFGEIDVKLCAFPENVDSTIATPDNSPSLRQNVLN